MLKMNTLIKDILLWIIENNASVKTVKFAKYPLNQNVSLDKDPSQQSTKQINTALNIRAETGFSFWESLMSTYISLDEFSDTFLSKALNHNSMLSYHEFNLNNLDEITRFIEKGENENIALLSSVFLENSETLYLPMIDFHLPVSEKNQKVAELTIQNLSLKKGFLINSGKSFHFIGCKLVSLEKLINLLAKMIFYAPIIDRNWLAHQIIERNCALRVNKGSKIKPKIIKKIC